MNQCSICKTEIEDDLSETWTDPQGESVEIELSSKVKALAETSVGEIYVCEECYGRGLPNYFDQDDLVEIYTQFGLGYLMSDDYEAAQKAFSKAIALERNPDTLANLACAESYLENDSLAKKLYDEALSIDPDHLMSNLNHGERS